MFFFSVLYLQYLELTVPIQILFQTVAFHQPLLKRMSFLIASKKLSLNFSDLYFLDLLKYILSSQNWTLMTRDN